MTNWRLENEQTSGAHAGRTLKCVVHGWHYEPTSVCAHCAPPDPPAPEVGMPVLFNGGTGVVVALPSTTSAGTVIGADGHGYAMASGMWLACVFPDFATPWAKSWNPAPAGTGITRSFTVADVEEAVATLKKGVVALEAANATPCHVCGKSNEYAHPANTSKGWRCTECRIIAGMM